MFAVVIIQHQIVSTYNLRILVETNFSFKLLILCLNIADVLENALLHDLYIIYIFIRVQSIFI